MTATRLWYPHYIRDFKAKTGHLSLAERGAYRALMDEYWERQGPLPSDDRSLCRLVGAFPDEWEQVRKNVLAFFEERDGLLHHARIDEEIAAAKKKHAAKSAAAAKARAHIRTDNSPDNSHDDRAETALLKATPSPTPSPTTSSKKTPSSLNNGGVGVFKIEGRLTDDARERAKRAAPGWDLYYLMQVYDEGVKKRGPPDNPSAAFPAWCARYTKGKSPSAA